ncbi:MAG TPA: ComEC/Rec2 family competence protein [Ktedonobacteraceae bacterium]|nr:ComEC/Rec2 family competence protein [Ktedonobacteraceae bacterium]
MKDQGKRPSVGMGIDLQGLILVVVASAWLIGIFSASFLPLPLMILLIGGGTALIGSLLFWHDTQSRSLLLLVFCIILGAWRYSIALPNNDPQAITLFIGSSSLQIRGTVTDEPQFQQRSRSLLITVNSVNRGASWQDAHGQISVLLLATVMDNPYGPNYGDTVELQGTLQPPLPYSTPGTFASMSFPHISVTGNAANPLLALLYQWRITLATLLTQLLPQPEAAVLIAILLGLRTPAIRPLASTFNVTGTVHLIVSSGFKVTILAGLVARSTSWLYDNQTRGLLPAQRYKSWCNWLSLGLVIMGIGAYTVLSGAGPAAIRAGTMGMLLVIAPRLGRTYNIYTALAIAAVLMSLFDPFVLWDVGFQLSFLGTLGIVMLTPFFEKMLHPIERLPFGHTISEIIAVTLAAQVATLPILAVTFNEISFISPLANLLTVPLLGILIMLGVLLCATGLLLPFAAPLLSWIAWPLLWYVIAAVTWCANLPGAYITVNSIAPILAWGYYAALAIFVISFRRFVPRKQKGSASRAKQLASFQLSRRSKRLIQLSAAILIVAATGVTALATPSNAQLTITFLAVGPPGATPQGEAILVRTPDNKTILIDGGPDAASLSQALDSRLPPWQRWLDAVVLTAPRQDHLVGLQDVVQRSNIGEVIDAGMLHPTTTYALWKRIIDERKLPYVLATRGMTIPIGTQVALQVLWPTSPLHQGSNENRDNGLIFRLVAPGLHMLLLGAAAQSNYALEGVLANTDISDLQAEIVQFVAENNQPLPTGLMATLQQTHPRLLVITPALISKKQKAGSSGTAATTDDTVARLLSNQANWQVIQTAQVGTLEISSNITGWNMNIL